MRLSTPLTLGILLLAGCASSAVTTGEPAPDSGGAPAVDAPASESATPSMTDASGADAADAADAAPGADASVAMESGAPTCGAACAKLVGKVSRVAATKPQHGGKGKVYLAVFDHDPVGDRANAKVVGQALLPTVDFTADNASIAYQVDGLTPRAAAYYVIAFLDDDGNASSTGPAPSKGDLVSLDGISAPKVVIANPAAVTLDLPLSTAMPF